MKLQITFVFFLLSVLTFSQGKVKKIIDNCDANKLESFLDAGGDINEKITLEFDNGPIDYSLLCYAVGESCFDCVEVLLNRKNDIEDFERDLSESFAFSLSRKNDEVSELLFGHLSNFRGVCDICNGNNALMVAASYGREEWYERLKGDSDINYINNGGANLLHSACFGTSKKILLDVIETTELDINGPDSEGMTPLDYAASNPDFPESYTILKEKGADPSKAWDLLYWYSIFPGTHIKREDLKTHEDKIWNKDEDDYMPLMNFAVYHYNYSYDMDAEELGRKVEYFIDLTLNQLTNEHAKSVFTEFYYQEKINEGILDALYYAADYENDNPIFTKYLRLLTKAYLATEYQTLTKRDYKSACKIYGKDRVNEWFDSFGIEIL